MTAPTRLRMEQPTLQGFEEMKRTQRNVKVSGTFPLSPEFEADGELIEWLCARAGQHIQLPFVFGDKHVFFDFIIGGKHQDYDNEEDGIKEAVRLVASGRVEWGESVKLGGER